MSEEQKLPGFQAFRSIGFSILVATQEYVIFKEHYVPDPNGPFTLVSKPEAGWLSRIFKAPRKALEYLEKGEGSSELRECSSLLTPSDEQNLLGSVEEP